MLAQPPFSRSNVELQEHEYMRMLHSASNDVPLSDSSSSPVESSNYEYLPDFQSSSNHPVKPKCVSSARTLCVLIVIILLLLLSTLLLFSMRFFFSEATSSTVSTEKNMQVVLNKSKSSDYCSPGYSYFEQTGHCYKATPVPCSFQKAEAACQADGAHLTSIRSDVESLFVSGLYHTTHREHDKSHYLKTKYIFWIGMIRSNETWEWIDGSPVDFENWMSEEQEGTTREQWAAIGPTGVLWFWTTQTEGGFVCKKPSVRAGMDTSLSKPEEGECLLGYHWFQATGPCYLVSIQEQSFEDARKSCSSDNASLVSIHSELENILLNGLIMKTLEENDKKVSKLAFWIGLIIKDRQYVWEDGSAVDFFDWYPTEHKYVPGRDRFAWTYWTSWRPEKSSNHGYICKMSRRSN